MNLIKTLLFFLPLYALGMSSLDINLEQLITSLQNLTTTIKPELFAPQFDLLPFIQNTSYNQLDPLMPQQKIIIKQDAARSFYQLWVNPQRGAECVLRAIQNSIFIINTITSPSEQLKSTITQLVDPKSIDQLCPLWLTIGKTLFPQRTDPTNWVSNEEKILLYFTTMKPAYPFPPNLNTIAHYIVSLDFFPTQGSGNEFDGLEKRFKQFKKDIQFIQNIDASVLDTVARYSRLLGNGQDLENNKFNMFCGLKALQLLTYYQNNSNSIFGVAIGSGTHKVSIVSTKYQGTSRHYYTDSLGNNLFNVNNELLKNWIGILSFENYTTLIFPTWYYTLFYYHIYSAAFKPTPFGYGRSIISRDYKVTNFDDVFTTFYNSLQALAQLNAFGLPEYTYWKPYMSALLEQLEQQASQEPGEKNYMKKIQQLKQLIDYQEDSATAQAYAYLLQVHK